MEEHKQMAQYIENLVPVTSSAASDTAEVDGDQDIKVTAWTLSKESFKRINVSWEGEAVLHVRSNNLYV